jgi:hypothetical protein
MGTSNRAIAALAMAALLSAGCFGYNKSAKRWSYVGDTLLLLSGGGVIALDLTSGSEPCMSVPGMPCPYEAPLTGPLVAGAVLAAAGLFGMIFNATRPNVRTSR